MMKWNRLLKVLDDTIGFPDKKSSRMIKRGEQFNNRTGEHVIYLEYWSAQGAALGPACVWSFLAP